MTENLPEIFKKMDLLEIPIETIMQKWKEHKKNKSLKEEEYFNH